MLLSATVSAQPQNTPTAPSDIKKQMQRVADWQLKHPKHEPYDWTNGAFYAGIMATYEATGKKKYLKAAKKMVEANDWQPGPRLRHADDHAIAQTYLDLYALENEPKYYQGFKDTIDKMMNTPVVANDIQVIDWWWCDALFMAPPALAKLAKATGDRKYLTYMDKLFRETYDLLYNQEEHLFARDLNYVIAEDGSGRREANGERIFWSRGNGWVMGGLVRVLEELPDNYPNRDFYLQTYREMADRIATLQQSDGFWRASLLDPDSYPGGEASGTGFYCYALAWGINHGVLDRGRYEPVVTRAWQALNGAVQPSGMLGWVQQIGADPRPTSVDSWEVYGTGAFLLAGNEMITLYNGGK